MRAHGLAVVYHFLDVDWLEHSHRVFFCCCTAELDPVTGRSLGSKKRIPNLALRKMIEDWREKNPGVVF